MTTTTDRERARQQDEMETRFMIIRIKQKIIDSFGAREVEILWRTKGLIDARGAMLGSTNRPMSLHG
jgi:hypothetical protein